MKRILAAVMAAVMSISAGISAPKSVSVAVSPQMNIIEDSRVEESGKCGVDAYWELSGDRLVITGNGEMGYWDTPDRTPWGKIRDRIGSVEIGEGITSVGACAFASCLR